MENQTESQETQILRKFYNTMISDLKNQIADLSEQKALQYALQQQDKQIIQQLKEQLENMEKQVIEKKKGA